MVSKRVVLADVQEDVNGEKLTVKKWWIFGADFSRFTQSFSRFIRDINGEKKISLLMIFFTVSFSRFAPPRDVPRYQKPERGYIQMFPGTKIRNEGTFAKTVVILHNLVCQNWAYQSPD